jgi:hypothetical protein
MIKSGKEQSRQFPGYPSTKITTPSKITRTQTHTQNIHQQSRQFPEFLAMFMAPQVAPHHTSAEFCVRNLRDDE